MKKFHVFVCHQGELNKSMLVPYEGLIDTNLEKLQLNGRYRQYGSRLAEARAFNQDFPAGISHLGYLSWRVGAKRADGLTWRRMSNFLEELNDSQGFAPYLWNTGGRSLEEMSRNSFPGMEILVGSLYELFPPVFDNPWDVAGNSFVIPTHEFREFSKFTDQILDWEVWNQMPRGFRFKCHQCGEVSNDGHGRYTSARDIALFLEVSTMYYFRYRSSLEFKTIPTSVPRKIWFRMKSTCGT